MNHVSLIGRLTKDIELKHTNSGKVAATFSLAVPKTYTTASGERQTNFIQCVVWEKSAENLQKYTSKGVQLGIDGEIQTRSYENQNGQKVYVTEVLVQNFTLLSSSNKTKQQNNAQEDPFINNGQEIPIDDNDLPF